MAYEVASIEYNGISAGTYSYVADTVADMNGIPLTDDVASGSTCIVTGTGAVYILSAARTWEALGSGGGGGGTSNAVLYTPQTLTAAQQAQARSNIGAVKPTSRTATISVADWNATTKAATCAITGLRVDSDTTQLVHCLFTDNSVMKSAKPWFSCAVAGTLTVTCQGTIPASAVTVQVVMEEI